MRILHLVHQYPPEYVGGTEYYTQSVAQALTQRGHSVAVFTRRNGDGKGSSQRMDGDVAVHLAWNGELTPGQRFLTTFGHAAIAEPFDALLAQFNPHLIHIQHMLGMPTALLEHILQRKIPFVLTLHDFWWVCANAQLITNYSGEICDGPNLWLNCARCVLARSQKQTFWPAILPVAAMLGHRSARLNRLMKAATRIIAPSQFVKTWYSQHGISTDKIVVLKHGVDRHPKSLPANHPPEIQPTARRPIRLLYAGGLSWQKGIHIPIEAIASIVGDIELWIAGDERFDPEYSERLHRLAAQNGAGRVRFLGRLSHTQVQRHLADADAAIVPALWYETFSLFVHEAFAAGTPVIASNLGALAEAVRHAKDGLLLPPGDVQAWASLFQRILSEPGLLADLRSNIQRPLSVAEHIDHLLGIYAEAVDPLSSSQPEVILSL
ncbi:MAG: glycosyltransferase family 4 protein [Caldilineaceae bacterium]|nr:glycosyltransferase family 4 protein [Caldilineaceae bacterium]HRJ44568.1 glycosyltransferase family 4 protein [Caldilineaceae bacterium]